MRLNRRNVLVGLGTIVAGGGAALGTGAFSSVEATRTADISVAGDSGALLTLNGKTSSELINENSGTIGIDQSNINLKATTTVEEAIEIVNGANQEVKITVSLSATDGDATSPEDIINLEYNDGVSSNQPTYDSDGSNVSDGSDLIADSGTDAWVFSSSDSVTVDLVIDTNQDTSLSDGNNIIDEMTIRAEETN